jgi:hypothetical protein
VNIPGNSVRETGLRINEGAVRAERSPEKVAMLLTKDESWSLMNSDRSELTISKMKSRCRVATLELPVR